MQVCIGQDARSLGIVHPVVATIRGITVAPSPPSLVAVGHKIVEQIEQNLTEHLTRPEVRGFRNLFAKMGYPDLEPAGERLVRTFVEKGFKSINSVVDAYNIAALEAASGIGMHDIDRRTDNLFVQRASGVESIIPIFKNKAKAISAGDLIYMMGSKPLAWLGKKDVDSNEYCVTDMTNTIILVVLGNEATSREFNLGVVDRCVELLRFSSDKINVEQLAVRFF